MGQTHTLLADSQGHQPLNHGNVCVFSSLGNLCNLFYLCNCTHILNEWADYIPQNIFFYLSIYLYTLLISPLKGSSQEKAFRVQEDFTLPPFSVSCLYTGKNTEEWLLRSSLRPFRSPFIIHREYSGSIPAAPTTGENIFLNKHIYSFPFFKTFLF